MPTQIFNQPQMFNALEFMGTPGQFFYVPAYQRDFSWTEENLKRFFEDVQLGATRLLREEGEIITFIGTMLCLHDAKFRAIHPIVRPDVPRGTYTVIDGQQRLTMLTLASVSLHNALRVAGKRGGMSQWLDEKRVECMSQLVRMIEEEMPVGECPFFPRVIRAFEDKWAKSNQRLYTSPLAHFTSSYCEFCRANPGAGKNYKHKPLSFSDENRGKKHAEFLRAVNRVEQLVQRVIVGKDKNFPDIGEIMVNQPALSSLFNVETLPQDAFVPGNEKHAHVARAIVFASYVLHKIQFVSLVALDENYAFDIFEALNTTGQVLTAYETFRPEVIRAEGIEKFENSESQKHTDCVGGYLDSLEKKNQKIKTTGELLISFALAENGATLPKALREQRKYLREAYSPLKPLSESPERREFTRHLMHAAEVMQIWNREGSAKISGLFQVDESLKQEADAARFCLDFLAASNHHIVRALVTRFHEAARLADEGRVREKIADLFSAVKALAAFYAIWRGSRENTDGIDGRHRKLMRDHFSRMTLTPDGKHVLRDVELSAEDVKRALVSLLKEDGGNSDRKIRSRGDWVKHAAVVPIYSTPAPPIARFLLLVAAHNARPMENGLLESARDGARPLIAEDAWRKEDYASVEHVIPQSENSNLGCEKGDLLRLGNLTLIPNKANSILGNRRWEQKKAIFRALSAETEPELQKAINAPHFPPDHRESEYLRVRYLPMTRAVSLSLCEYRAFLAEHVQKRGENLAELAWQRLAVDWLGFDPPP